MTKLGLIAVIAAAGSFGLACSESIGSDDLDVSDVVGTGLTIQWQDAAGLPETVEPGGLATLTVLVEDANGPVADADVAVEILFGGGTLTDASLVTDAEGLAVVEWRPGRLPVRAAVRASLAHEPAFVDHVVQVQAGDAMAPTTFGGVQALLEGAGVEGSTEGLTFDDAGNLWLAVPGNLVRITDDGQSSLVAVGGDGLKAPLGMAWDYLRRAIWVADTASVRKVTIQEDDQGVFTATAQIMTGLEGLVTPNSIAIRDNVYVYLTDSCTGGVYRFQPSADSPALETVATFDLATQGGPNGLAFDDSSRLWVTTENVGLLCLESGVDVTANVGGLYSLDIGGQFPLTPEPRLEGFAMFGDGMAFDEDGNLYVIFDRFDGFTLKDSAVWLVPQSGDPVMVISVPVPDGATSPDRLIANVAWGWDEFGSGTLYFSLLAVSLVTTERGAMSVPVDIGGRPLLPTDLPQASGSR